MADRSRPTPRWLLIVSLTIGLLAGAMTCAGVERRYGAGWAWLTAIIVVVLLGPIWRALFRKTAG